MEDSLAGKPPSKSAELLPSRPLRFRPCDAVHSCRIAQDKQPSVVRGSHSAWSRRRRQPHPPSGQARVPPKGDMPPRQPLNLIEVLAKLAAVLETRSRSPKEEFGVDPGVATTETEHTEVLNGCGSGGGGVQRLGGHAQVQCIPRTRHEYPRVVIAAHETRVREDLMTLPGESWSWQRHTKEHLLHHCGHFRTLRSHREGCRSPQRGQNRRIRTAARDVVPDLQDTRIWSKGRWPPSGVGRCSDCPTPTHDPSCIGHLPRHQQLSLGTEKQPHRSQQRNS